MIEKIKYFIRLDIRKKLKLLNKYTKIQFYPSYFPKNGIKSIYTKIILNLFLFNEFKTYKKRFYNSIFNKKNINSKTNFLVSTPSSGSTFLRLMLQSYFELLYKVGDGIPKYDNVNNRMVFAASQIQSADLWNEVKIQNALVDTNKFIKSDEFEKIKFVMTRYPLGEMNLYKLNEIKPVVIFRNPYEVILSTYIKQDRRASDDKEKTINSDILHNRIAACEKYIFFWKNFFDTKKHKIDFLVVDYNGLVNETNKVFKQVLEFYGYEINETFIDKSSNLHSSENTLKLFKDIKIYNRTRFSNPELKKDQEKIVYPFLDDVLKNKNLMDAYNSIIREYKF